VAAPAEALAGDQGEPRMIRPLRKAHLRIWIVLAVVLPVLLVGSLIVRQETTPTNPELRWERFK
jgi:hypothetical protein